MLTYLLGPIGVAVLLILSAKFAGNKEFTPWYKEEFVRACRKANMRTIAEDIENADIHCTNEAIEYLYSADIYEEIIEEIREIYHKEITTRP